MAKATSVAITEFGIGVIRWLCLDAINYFSNDCLKLNLHPRGLVSNIALHICNCTV